MLFHTTICACSPYRPRAPLIHPSEEAISVRLACAVLEPASSARPQSPLLAGPWWRPCDMSKSSSVFLSVVPTGVEFAGIGLKKCVTSVLAPHTGRVITAECSPHHRNAILSAASDNEIRLYSLLQPNKPVSVIYSEQNISCAHWSLSRPLGVAVGLVTGQVVLYDFGLKNCEPSLTLPAAEKPSPITTTAFNKKNMALIAAGDQLGRVSLWQLPNSAVSPTPTELSTLFTLLGNLAE
ncbi:putative WD repeat-containing protein 34 [Penaeus vannamei]|uniref:Putative WD repeat-containing protein 34 n=1 Tax=Penaeus vannamei TaxID=6689 RepID=A0A423SUH2_PENVA|nr:putative WD repeat-containing protein 34 [Penaeus vannamei]